MYRVTMANIYIIKCENKYHGEFERSIENCVNSKEKINSFTSFSAEHCYRSPYIN